VVLGFPIEAGSGMGWAWSAPPLVPVVEYGELDMEAMTPQRS